MPLHRTVPGAVVLVLSLAACPKGETYAPDEVTGAYQQSMDAVCETMERCGQSDPGQKDECQHAQERHFMKYALKSMTMGYRVMKRAPLEACVEKVRKLDCSTVSLNTLASSCNTMDMYLPNSGKGEPCVSVLDCKDGLKCVGERWCQMTCQDHDGFRAVGESCSGTGTCDSSQGFCDGKTCQAFAADGATCGVAPCGRDSYCDGDGVCRPALAKGVACTRSTQCQRSLACISGTCQEKLATNASCTDPAQCAPTSMFGLELPGFCEPVTKTCLPSVRNPGESCNANVSCMNSRCKGATATTLGTCQTDVPAREGESCADTSCVLGTFCEKGTCKPLSSKGGTCDSNSGCMSLLTCSEGKCTVPGEEGAACGDCKNGLLCDTSTHKCVGPLPSGSSCLNAEQCQSFDCSAGTCSSVCKL